MLASEKSDTRSSKAEIRQTVLARTGLFTEAVHFPPRGFAVKSSSGGIARAESFRKYKSHVAPHVA
jgi:hypothetical protein